MSLPASSLRRIMANSPHDNKRILEGIFAIHKPTSVTSAAVLRTLQSHFDQSKLFAPWLAHEKRRLALANSKARTIRNLKCKLGHGGTLDPLATGVLIVGMGKGTKCLGRFLECTKSYECVVLFGAATDSYDSEGKVVKRAGYEHVTKEMVEKALEGFKGKIMQKPPIFSALKVDGKKMYEYARAGKDIPEVKEREVEVKELELVEWLESGSHEYEWPKEEIVGTEKAGAEKLMGVKDVKDAVEADLPAIDNVLEAKEQDAAGESNDGPRGMKRVRAEDQEDLLVTDSKLNRKRPKMSPEPLMSGALPEKHITDSLEEALSQPNSQNTSSDGPHPTSSNPNSGPKVKPPAARIRMTVTSGFYVRSLCQDLGIAVNSLGLMSALVRTRQGDYSLYTDVEKNPDEPGVLEYSDLDEGEEVWGPKVSRELEKFMQKEDWDEESVGSDEEWEKTWTENSKDKVEGLNDRSGQKGRDGKGHGRGRNGGYRRKNWRNDRRDDDRPRKRNSSSPE